MQKAISSLVAVISVAIVLAFPVTAFAQDAPTVEGFEPVVLDDKFVVLYYYFIYVEHDETTYLLGEIENTSGSAAAAPVLLFEYFDEQGFSYGSDAISPMNAIVPAGSRMPFFSSYILGNSVDFGEWTSVEVTAGAPYSSVQKRDTSQLVFEGVPANGQFAEVAGTEAEIRNESDLPVKELSLVVALYDEGNRFIGMCGIALGPIGLPPGKAAHFEMPDQYCSAFDTTILALDVPGSEEISYRLIPIRWDV